jgi:hypothetical protein
MTSTCAVSAWTSTGKLCGDVEVQDAKTEATGRVDRCQGQGQVEKRMPNVFEGTARAGPGLQGYYPPSTSLGGPVVVHSADGRASLQVNLCISSSSTRRRRVPMITHTLMHKLSDARPLALAGLGQLGLHTHTHTHTQSTSTSTKNH